MNCTLSLPAFKTMVRVYCKKATSRKPRVSLSFHHYVKPEGRSQKTLKLAWVTLSITMNILPAFDALGAVLCCAVARSCNFECRLIKKVCAIIKKHFFEAADYSVCKLNFIV